MKSKIVWWTLTVLCAAAILGFSLQSVPTSLAISGQLTDMMLENNTEYQELPPIHQQIRNDKIHDRLRDSAHVIMFIALSFCASMLVRSYLKKWWALIAVPFSMLYGIFDEFVQRCMHNGRTFQWSDVSRDCLGVVIGSGLALITAACLWLLKRRRV